MTKSPNCGKMRVENPSATRFKVNPNWNYRGDNTKYKEKK
jgi:hypothetical protein